MRARACESLAQEILRLHEARACDKEDASSSRASANTREALALRLKALREACDDTPFDNDVCGRTASRPSSGALCGSQVRRLQDLDKILESLTLPQFYGLVL